jgi:hypothetical protein
MIMHHNLRKDFAKKEFERMACLLEFVDELLLDRAEASRDGAFLSDINDKYQTLLFRIARDVETLAFEARALILQVELR